MLNDLDTTLKELLKRELPDYMVSPDSPTPVEISFATPDPAQLKATRTINFFLYDVRENWELRSNEWHLKRNNGRVTQQPPPARVDCSYLITAWSPDSQHAAEQEHRFLGEVMMVLLRHPVLPAEVLQGELKGQEPPVRAKPLQASQLQSLGEFWQAMGSQPKAMLNYTVTISVQPHEPVDIGPPVTDKMLKFRLEKEVAP